MTSMMRRILALLALPMLAGCAAISALGDASRPLEIYELRTPAVQPVALGRRAVELVVEEPVASGALATERIMIRPTPLRAQYLPGVRWADPAPVMIQTLMVRSLLETGALGSVGRRPVGTSADFAILSELTDFHAEPVGPGDQAAVRIRLILRIVHEGNARVVATRSFSATGAAAATDADSLTAAFDYASMTLMSEIVPWILRRTIN